MLVEFLSGEQVAAFGWFVGEPAREELERFFFLDGIARGLVARRWGEHGRFGFAVQLGTVRFLGTFLTDPLDVAWVVVVEYLAGQLDVADPGVVRRYVERAKTAYAHAAEIKAADGYRDFADPGAADQLRGFGRGGRGRRRRAAGAVRAGGGVAAPVEGAAHLG